MHSYSSQELAKIDKHIGDFAKLRVIKRVAYNIKTLKNLNKSQKDAVNYLDGPLLIVAGAGSGKTKVLTSRIANIIKQKSHVNELPKWSNLGELLIV